MIIDLCKVNNWFHVAELNCEPLSVVIAFGIPNFDIHPWLNASTTDSADISFIGIAVAHLVKRSATVSRYEYPFDVGIMTMSA